MRQWLRLIMILVVLTGCTAGGNQAGPTQAPSPEPPAATSAPVPDGPAWIDVEVRVGEGTWERARSGATYAQEDLTLRIRLHGPVDEGALRQKLPKGGRVEKTAPDLLEVALENPPPYLWFFGVGSPGGDVQFYTGEPPHLVALDPTTGEERDLGELPGDSVGFYLAPDGGSMVGYDHPAPEEVSVWYLDLTSGRRQLIPLRERWYPTVHWYEGQVILATGMVTYWNPADGSMSEVESELGYERLASPDGRYLVGFTYEATIAGSVVPVDLAIYDVKERRTQTIAQATRAYIGTHWINLYMAWAPDSRTLFMHDHLSREPNRTLQLDLDTGAITPAAEPLVRPSRDQPVAGPQGWSYRPANWDAVTVIGPDGIEKGWGEGRTIGWLPDGRLLLVRWENAVHRRIWDGP